MITQDDWDHPPRNTTWTVVHTDRVELHDHDDHLLAWVRPDRGLSALHDATGTLAVTLRPEVKRNFSLRNLLALAGEGGIFQGNGQPYTRNPVSGPPLLVWSTRPQLPLAAITPADDGTHQVELLPAGALNDRLLRRNLAPETATHIRASNPLTLTAGADGVEELRDANGALVARATYDTANTGRPHGRDRRPDDHPQSVDVFDNDLPALALYAVLVGGHGWHS